MAPRMNTRRVPATETTLDKKDLVAGWARITGSPRYHYFEHGKLSPLCDARGVSMFQRKPASPWGESYHCDKCTVTKQQLPLFPA